MSEIISGVNTVKAVENPMAQENEQEVATESQNEQPIPAEIGNLIAESKKYRTRAQDSENKLANLEKQIKSQKEKRLAENNEWQELAEQREARIAELEPLVDRYTASENQMREDILNDFNEDDKAVFGDLPIDKLKVLHSKLTNQPIAVAPTDGSPARSSNSANKKWTEMTDEERRSNWSSIIDVYRKK